MDLPHRGTQSAVGCQSRWREEWYQECGGPLQLVRISNGQLAPRHFKALPVGFPRQVVEGTEEVGDRSISWVGIQFLGASNLLDPLVGQDDHPG